MVLQTFYQAPIKGDKADSQNKGVKDNDNCRKYDGKSFLRRFNHFVRFPLLPPAIGAHPPFKLTSID
jgi:hypothetical protein